MSPVARARRLEVPLEGFAAVVAEFEMVAAHGLEEYRSSLYVRRAAERLVQMAADLACDINCRILAAVKGRLPAGYEESFRDMADQGLLPAAVAEKMAAVAALRRSLLYDSRPDLDEQVHRRLPFYAILLREYGRSIEQALDTLEGRK